MGTVSLELIVLELYRKGALSSGRAANYWLDALCIHPACLAVGHSRSSACRRGNWEPKSGKASRSECWRSRIPAPSSPSRKSGNSD